MPAGSLLERQAELAAIDAAMASARAGEGRVVVIEGEPGIGKTALLDVAEHAARRAGMTALAARAGELERDFGFGVVRQLFELVAHDSDAASLFAGQARFAAPVLGLQVDGDGRTKPPLEPVFPAIHGLYWMTANLADDRPLALVIDDAQWADRGSLRFLAYLAPRIAELPVLVVIATRPGEAADRLVHRLGRPKLLRPQRLSARATAAVVRSLVPAAEPDLCRACHAATGGNVFYVREIAAALRDGELSSAAPSVEAWSPTRVTRAVAGRIAALDAAGRDVARACAVLGDGAGLRRIATLAGVDDDAARKAVDALRAAGVLSPSARLEFIHPIVRTAVEAGIPPGQRATDHATAARLEAGAGADPERVAAHLLVADPAEDAWVCRQLAEAARAALSRGAPEAATRYLERALEEPPPEDGQARLLLDLGTAAAFAFRPGAAAHVRRGFELARSEQERLDAALLHAHLSLQAGKGVEGLEPLEQVLEETPDDSDTALMIQGFAANFTRAQLSARRAARPIVDRLRERDDVGPDADPSVLIAIGAELAMMGRDRERSITLARAALERVSAVPPLARAFAGLTAARTLIVADDDERARAVLEQQMEAARSRGALFDFIYHAVSHANLTFRAGELHTSENDARAGYEIARGERWPLGLPSIAHYLVQALTERGEHGEAWEILADSGLAGPPQTLSDVYTSNPLLLARAKLKLAGGDPRGALTDLEELRVRQEAFAEHNPALSEWRSTTALALAELGDGDGDGDGAWPLVDEEIELARRWGAPRAIGIALRAAGNLTTGEEAEVHLREAVAVLAGSFAKLEYAHALAALGDRLIENGNPAAAREPLREALEHAHTCGATPLESRIVGLLRAAGARPRRAVQHGPGALTPSERRVAELAASGQSNRQIAEGLFVTVSTVEYHLSNVYRKLDIGARAQLGAALAGTEEEAATG